MTAAQATQQTPLPYPSVNHTDRLGLTIFFAVVLHSLIILGVSFTAEDREKPPEKLPGLEVTLVQTKTDKDIKDADFLAQANQVGGGNTSEAERPTTPVDPVVATGEDGDISPFVPETTLPSSTDPQGMQLITAMNADQKVEMDTSDPDAQTDTENMTSVQLLSHSKEIAKLSAELEQSRKQYASRPRKVILTAANAKKYDLAPYEESWRKKIERIGTLNFPDEARRSKLSGNLRIAVTIYKDGTVKKVKITKYSGHKILDDAAVRIVKMAAPFAPFTESMLEKTDEIVIIRTWQFMADSKKLRTSASE